MTGFWSTKQNHIMNTKQLAVLGGGVAAVAKFYTGLDWKGALTLGVVAIIAASIADNVAP